MILEVFEAEKADVESAKIVVSHRIVGSHNMNLLLPAAVIDLPVPMLKYAVSNWSCLAAHDEPRA